MAPTAGWFPDPYGRFQQRYFDGSQWTAHVFDHDVQQLDPLGNTPSIPFVAPMPGPVVDGPPSSQSAVASTAEKTAAARLSTFLDSLGPDARTRPTARLSIALAGVGGLAASLGVAAAIIGDSVGGRARNTIAATVVVVIAYAVRLSAKSQPELRSAAVGAAVIGIPGLATSITDGGDGGGFLSLMAIMLIAAWVLPGMRGRPLMLGLGSVAVVLATTTIGNPSTESDLFDLGPADLIGGYTWLFVLVGVAFLAMVWWLDARGYHGVGTSLVVATILATALAVVKVVQDLGSTGAALLLLLAGLAVAVVGDHGQRRASTWFGVGVAAIGTIAFFFSALEPNTVGDTSATLIVSGLVLAVAPVVLQGIRASRSRQPEA